VPLRIAALTALAMLAFAGNSLLCRLALTRTGIDAASFTALRLASGALLLYLLVRLRRGGGAPTGNWVSALALFGYAAAFSFAYLSLTAATGALLLFGAVQITMIGYGLCGGERLRLHQWTGLTVATAGLVGLLLPGLSAPPWQGALLMFGAGAAWGIYSLRGRTTGSPVEATAGNFLRATLFAAVLSILLLADSAVDARGVACAVASGALASGLGYVLWYQALAELRATSAGIVQLSVPALAAVGGSLLLDEPVTLHLLLASAAILGGVALATVRR